MKENPKLNILKYCFGIDIKNSLNNISTTYYDNEINYEQLTYNFI